jgi:hypothetical protein
MDGDRPITTSAEDRLGFAVVAEHLAKAILDQSSRNGFVIGIDGKWGSGKSTLINLTIGELKKADVPPAVVTFSPWLVGDRDTLLRQLFDELALAALQIEPAAQDAPKTLIDRIRAATSNSQWRVRQKERAKKRLARRLLAFGTAASAAGKIARTADDFGIPFAAGAASVAQGTSDATTSFLGGGALSKRKAELETLLKPVSRPIVVFVDDLDRLEPMEATEVLRLIRAVADFPNVIYVLSYDAGVVASTLEAALGIDEGDEFLEKIVQVGFKVAQPEAFDLRNWFRTEVLRIFADPGDADGRGDSTPARLDAVINTQGGAYLKTPRDVVRTLNALHLHTAPIRGLFDVPDMVWLQLVKIGNPDLYSWVENYLSESTAVINGAHVSDEDAAAIGGRLDEILAAEGGDVGLKLIELTRILPGIDYGQMIRDRDNNRTVLKGNLLSDHFISPLVREKRLGSPQHYRYYFSFSEPAGALRDESVREFIAEAEANPENALATFRALSEAQRPQGGSMADVLLDRLLAVPDRVPPSAVLGIIDCLTETLDDIARSSPSNDFGTVRTWNLGAQAVRVFLRNLPPEMRTEALDALFTDGASLGWLTDIMRTEIFDHGVFGDRRTPEDQWLLTGDEFNAALDAMLGRYRTSDPDELMRTPNFLSLLYGWQQGSETDEAKEWVVAQSNSDAALLKLLPRMRSIAFRNAVVYPLNKDDMERFFDYPALLERVQSIIDSPDTSEQHRSTANTVMAALRLGDRANR